MMSLRVLPALLALIVLASSVAMSAEVSSHSSMQLNLDTKLMASINARDSHIEFIEVDAFDSEQADQLTEPCPSGCNSNGVCTQDGQCYCYDGFTGPDCAERICPAACHLHGDCKNGICHCKPGWAGYDCSYRGCKDDCSGHGACHIGPYTSECQCFPGYTGEYCQVSISSLTHKVGCKNDCSGNGLCVNNTCACREGFVGAYCQQRNCEHNCHGRGLCDPATGTCHCFDQTRFGGKFCEVAKCPNQCNGNGECLPTGACKCKDGFYGLDCHPHNCKENCNYPNGKCIVTPTLEVIQDKQGKNKTIKSFAHARGTCKCHGMYSGETCTKVQCPLGCSGNGVCDPATLTCKCNNGWAGEGCSLKACPHKCVNGHCVDGKCVCSPNWKGEDCTEPWTCPNNCGGKGTCFNGKCYCNSGYTGDSCERDLSVKIELQLDKPSPTVTDPAGCKPACVAGQGVCLLVNDRFVCQCLSGQFSGPTCADKGFSPSAGAPVKKADTKVCDPPCASPGGHCLSVDGKSPAQCLCSPGFGGPTCAIREAVTPTAAPAAAEKKPQPKEDKAKPQPQAKEQPKPQQPATEQKKPETPAPAQVEASSASAATPSLMEVDALAEENGVIYQGTEAARMAAALEDDQRDDAMLLQALDHLLDYSS